MDQEEQFVVLAVNISLLVQPPPRNLAPPRSLSLVGLRLARACETWPAVSHHS